VALPDDVDPRALDPDARKELRSLSKEAAELVAKHLVMAGRLLDDEPEAALAHARAARAMAARIGVVREAVGLAAYAMEQWTEALAELRAARRITGRPDHLAVFADCERALGRPERALTYADDPAVPGLPQEERVELVIVLAGARADMGQVDAAVLTLQEPALRTSAKRSWAGRLWYAYADMLAKAGRAEQAREWFARVVELDDAEATDAVDRLLELDGVELIDLADEAEAEAEASPFAGDEADLELAAYIERTYGATRAPGPVGEPVSGPEVEPSMHVDGLTSADPEADGPLSAGAGPSTGADDVPARAPGPVVPPAFSDGTQGSDAPAPAPGQPEALQDSDGETGAQDAPLRLFE
jgi:hypothetical protein